MSAVSQPMELSKQSIVKFRQRSSVRFPYWEFFFKVGKLSVHIKALIISLIKLKIIKNIDVGQMFNTDNQYAAVRIILLLLLFIDHSNSELDSKKSTLFLNAIYFKYRAV